MPYVTWPQQCKVRVQLSEEQTNLLREWWRAGGLKVGDQVLRWEAHTFSHIPGGLSSTNDVLGVGRPWAPTMKEFKLDWKGTKVLRTFEDFPNLPNVPEMFRHRSRPFSKVVSSTSSSCRVVMKGTSHKCLFQAQETGSNRSASLRSQLKGFY